MMLRRLPMLPTIIVLIAVGIMLGLGLWQLDRMHEKDAMLARYAASAGQSGEVDWPADAAAHDDALFRRSTLDCREVTGLTSMAGNSAEGASGLAHVATCRLVDGGTADVVLGWARDPRPREWSGGRVRGIVAPGAGDSVRLIADPPLAGLEASASPDPRDIPNNHWSYAIQWFLFAALALVIYALAVRKRLAGEGAAR